MPTPSPTPDRPGRRARGTLAAGAFALTISLAALAACGDTSEQSASEAAAGADAGPGTELYAANCASCHGVDLRGTDQGPSHLSIVYEPSHHGDDSFRSAVAQGARAHHWNFGDMPAVPGLDDDEVDAIIAFIRAEQEREGFEPYEHS
jgi:mono/diheme cytochrome c family protein